MRITFLFVLLFSTAFFTSAQETQEQSLIWQISGGDLQGKSYIVATIPVQDSTFYQYPDKLWKLLDRSDVFIAFDQTTLNDESEEVRDKSFGDLPKHYAIFSAEYMQTIAQQQAMPVINISNDLSYQNSYNRSSAIISDADTKSLEDAFFTGNVEEIVESRLSLDLSIDIIEELQSSNNYEILNELINAMRLQPVFFPVDAAYLAGQNGLLNLLRARGFRVKAEEDKYYARNAEFIAQRNAQLAMIQQGNTTTPPNPVIPSNTTGATSGTSIPVFTPTESIDLDLPIGIINLKEWSEYQLKDSLLVYRLPIRLKSAGENTDAFKASANELDYSIQFRPAFENLNQAIEQLIISNGGQLTRTERTTVKGVNAMFVELMYAENILSKHLIIPYLNQGILVSVKGQTPQIFSLQASDFLESISLKPPTMVQTRPGINNPAPVIKQPGQVAVAPVWQVESLEKMSIYLPVQPRQIDSTLTNGIEVRNFVIPRGTVDENVYVVSVAEKTGIDSFRLFNEAVNEASAKSRAVVEERNVMPDGKTYYAEYLLKDAVDNYYKISYWYDGSYFYQFIVKGDKKSVENNTAQQIKNSISISNLQISNATN